MADTLTEKELKTKMKKIPNWEVEGNAITRTVQFEEYSAGIDFVVDVAEIAEKLLHHPDIDVRWGKVVVRCMTHRVNGITEEDVELANRIDNLID